MKKQTLFTYFTGAAICACVILSCQKEQVQNEESSKETKPAEEVVPGSGGTVLFTVGMEDTKTYLSAPEASGSFRPRWHASDYVMVNGIQSSALTLKNSGLSAEFTVDGVSAPYCCVAPSTAYSAYSSQDQTVSVLVRGTGNPQSYSATGGGAYATYDRNAGIFAACSTEEDMVFKPVMTYYKITVEGGDDLDNIQRIYLRQAGDNPNIAGNWTISFTGGTPVMSPSILSAIIALDCGEDGVAQGTPMIVGIPAYDYEDGLIITLKDVNGHFVSKTIPATETALAAKAGTIITKTIAFSPKSGTIDSAAKWNEFAAMVNGATNDWDLYKYVGNGTVKVKSFTADRALTKITGVDGKFSFNVDGSNGNATQDGPAVITQSGSYKAGSALFQNIRGTVSSLILDGELSSNVTVPCAGLVDSLYAGATLAHVTNRMAITSTGTSGGSRAGIVGVALGGNITDCHNSGDITLTANCTTEHRSCQIGGIVAQTNVVASKPSGNVVLTDCSNSGTLTVNPVFDGTTYGINYAGMGGIVAWVRSNSYSVTLNNCDNSGSLTWNKPDAAGAKKQTSVGGIIGIGAPVNQSTMLAPASDNGMMITLKDCDNSGAITCKALSNSASGESRQKVYIGGLAGSLFGQESSPIVVDHCTSTAPVTPYDITSDAPYNDPTASQRAPYCAVLGGISGWSGYISVTNGTVVNYDCLLGTSNRQMVAIAGAFGFAMRKFSISDSYIFCRGRYNRCAGYKGNRAVIAVVPVCYNTTAMEAVPDISGSSLTNCHMGGVLGTNTSTYDTETTCLNTTGATLFNSESKTLSNLVCGQGYSTASTDVTVTGYTYWTGHIE